MRITLPKVSARFIQQIREEYAKGTHILDIFDYYLSFILRFGKGEEIKEIERWQYDDMCMSIYNPNIDYHSVPLETCWNKNRRSGKTLNASLLSVFFSIIDKDCIWRTPNSNQLKAAFKWYLQNPFVEKVYKMGHLVNVMNSPSIDIAVLSPGNCTGIEGNVVFFDEGGWVEKHKVVYEGYKQARPMISSCDFKHIIHFSTPARNTAFEEVWRDIGALEKKLDTKLRVRRTAEDCDWITEEFIESEKRANYDCPWYVDQNYYGQFVVYGGAVFDAERIVDINQAPVKIQDQWDSTRAKVGGVDFNTKANQHYLVIGNDYPDYVFIRDELKFWDLNFLKKYDHWLNLEIEDGGYNIQFTKDCRAIGVNASYKRWSGKDGSILKHRRVRSLQEKTIYINKAKCNLTYLNLKEAAYDQNRRLPRLEKRSGQHGLDCVLHMVDMTQGSIDPDAMLDAFNDYEQTQSYS